jgi:hypothetical protein
MMITKHLVHVAFPALLVAVSYATNWPGNAATGNLGEHMIVWSRVFADNDVHRALNFTNQRDVSDATSVCNEYKIFLAFVIFLCC